MSKYDITTNEFEKRLVSTLARFSGVKIEDASKNQIYKAICIVIRDILTEKRIDFKKKVRTENAKQIYYMSMEFLLGRSLKNHLYNMGIQDQIEEGMKSLGLDPDEIYGLEPDAGLGNGGLGRLAAAYMDALTSQDYPAHGFSIMYDYGIFKQVLVDGWQLEKPDDWLKMGSVWLNPRMEEVFEVVLGGNISEKWTDGKLEIEYKNATKVLAVPYDLNISGYDTESVNKIRLWSAKAPIDFDMTMFSRGEYVKAMEAKSMAESISKVLYPADDHVEGKSLRLKQQYFFVSASVQSIIKRHLKTNENLDNLPECAAIHINDTHPTLCIPELMRILLDVYGYDWESAWDITTKTVSYTNHTVMAEALEKWPEELFKNLLPRIYQIVSEINRRFCEELKAFYPNDLEKIKRNSILGDTQIRMANLCLATSNTINGVSKLHSDILKRDVFADYNRMHPEKFTNVTNGITHRRWVAEANPLLANMLKETIGDSWLKKPNDLQKLLNFYEDENVLNKLADIKHQNKIRLANYIQKTNGIVVDPNSIFDVQVKRLHEYKRQLLNAIHILDLYYRIKENPSVDIEPRTFVFSAKAASAYYMAKQIIKLIYMIGEVVNNDKDVDGRIKVVFLENYCVSLAEIIIPASEISEQISLAGKEASGTGNMKFMINGALTLGTLDGANVEMHEEVGDDNIFLFGLLTEQVQQLYASGYNASKYYNENHTLKRIIDNMRAGIGGVSFESIADSLTLGSFGQADTYMVLADFESYKQAQQKVQDTYRNKQKWNQMSLVNIAKAGFFAADRSVKEYADRIWKIRPVK